MKLSFFHVLLFVSCASSPLPSYSLQKNLEYKQTATQKLIVDVYRPKSSKTTSAVIVHGGGWARRSGDMTSLCEHLVRAGFTVFNITYSLAPKSLFPDALEDGGYSAGGHLAILTAVQRDSGIQAVVAGGAPTDLTAYPKSPLIRDFTGIELKDRPELWRAASPALSKTNTTPPPMFLYLGEFDMLVGIDQMKIMDTKLKELNTPVETYQVNWLGHLATYGFARPAINRGIKFLKSQ